MGDLLKRPMLIRVSARGETSSPPKTHTQEGMGADQVPEKRTQGKADAGWCRGCTRFEPIFRISRRDPPLTSHHRAGMTTMLRFHRRPSAGPRTILKCNSYGRVYALVMAGFQ